MIHSSITPRHAATAGIPKRTEASRLNVAANPAWFEAGVWRLPSGKALSEFALQSGFLVPHLFAAEGHSSAIGSLELARESGKRAG